MAVGFGRIGFLLVAPASCRSIFRMIQAIVRTLKAARARFRLHGVQHYVYINNETEVVREMRKFLGLPVGGN